MYNKLYSTTFLKGTQHSLNMSIILDEFMYFISLSFLKSILGLPSL